MCSHMLAAPGVSLRLATRVAEVSLDVTQRKWMLRGSSDGDLGEFDALVMADVLCAKRGGRGQRSGIDAGRGNRLDPNSCRQLTGQ